jgi:hypothetical protein
MRRRYLSPMPEVQSLNELNDHLRAACAQAGQVIRPGDTDSVAERWVQERAALLPLPPRPFDCARSVSVKATSTAAVVFQTNRYSLPVEYAHQGLLLKADVTDVRIFQNAQLVAEHVRCYRQHQRISDWRHYVPLLAHKPGAVPFAAALRNGDLAPSFEQFRRGWCTRHPNGNREFVQVLVVCLQYPTALITQAVAQAVQYGAYHVAALEHLVQQRAAPPVRHPLLTLEGHPDLAALAIPPVSTVADNQLLPGGAP